LLDGNIAIRQQLRDSTQSFVAASDQGGLRSEPNEHRVRRPSSRV
jgi:hypothetical protein